MCQPQPDLGRAIVAPPRQRGGGFGLRRQAGLAGEEIKVQAGAGLRALRQTIGQGQLFSQLDARKRAR